MIIALEDLAAKRVKSTPEVTVSDHTLTITSAAPKDHELIFTGKGTRGLVIRDPKGSIIFRGVTIDNASTGVTLKFDGTYDSIKVDGDGTTKLLGKAGNAASQMIYFLGTWSNVELCGFDIDQRRNSASGSTTTGACVQFAGVLKAGHNLRKVHEHDMTVRNAGDEGNYVNNFERGSGYAQGDVLLVENFKVFSSGRDFFQQWGFRDVTYRDCYGENGALESNKDHISALSMNGDTDSLLVENCEFKNIPQLVYSGLPTVKIKALFDNVRYTQGTHSGSRSNQAAYLKGRGDITNTSEYMFKNCTIDAPNALICAISADKCDVVLIGNKITAPKISREFEPASVTTKIPDPVTVTTHGDLIIETTTTWEGMISVKYYALIGDIKTELIVK